MLRVFKYGKERFYARDVRPSTPALNGYVVWYLKKNHFPWTFHPFTAVRMRLTVPSIKTNLPSIFNFK